MSRIIAIGTETAPYPSKQENILEFMHNAYADKTASRKLNALFHFSGIGSRYSVIPDFTEKQNIHSVLFNGTKPDVEKRMDVYKENAAKLAVKAIQNTFEDLKQPLSGISHLITVSCTGLYAPGIDSEIIEILNLSRDIFRTSVNFLGCNAAFPALCIANSIADSQKDAFIVVVCVELCTLHFQPKNNIDNLLSNTLFGDGAAAVVIASDEYAAENQLEGLNVNGFYSYLLSKGKQLMGWNVNPLNFEMILNSNLPEFIAENIKMITKEAFKKFNATPDQISKWAIHPGGKKILDASKT
ncbi:MAG: type III polyketide synthase [Bacteroidales bacterium]|nr:type III polyketide synthase [Bacteroidales bacterium]